MTAEWQKKIMDLFSKRKQKRMDLNWIEDEPWNPKYEGEEIKLKWSL